MIEQVEVVGFDGITKQVGTEGRKKERTASIPVISLSRACNCVCDCQLWCCCCLSLIFVIRFPNPRIAVDMQAAATIDGGYIENLKSVKSKRFRDEF